jgi:hypothetical protein
MEKISPGQIYLADQRGITETNTYRQCCSFNYGTYFNESRAPFGKLEVFNDEILAANAAVNVTIAATCYLVIIPVTGALLVKDAQGKTTITDVGEVAVNYTRAGDVLEFRNPYHEDWVNYLYLQIKTGTNVFPFFKQTFEFDFSVAPNQLVDLLLGDGKLPFKLHIGQFAGRTDTLYKLKNTGSLFYAFVIAGAFELQGRLMHERDGLALWDLEEADMEALSNNAVMLVLEMEQ